MVIVNSVGFAIGVPIWLLAISWAFTLYFLYQIVVGIKANFNSLDEVVTAK